MFTSTIALLSACLAASPPVESGGSVPESAPAAALPSAEAATSEERPRLYELRFDAFGDGVTTAFGALAWTTTETVSKSLLAAERCRWCDTRDGRSLNGLDRAGRTLRWGRELQPTADLLSNVTGFALMPLSVIALDTWLAHSNGALSKAPEDLVIIAQATVAALLLNQTLKFVFGRERPFLQELTAEERAEIHNPSDNNLSFFSGHATFGFSLAVATAVVAELRGYDGARWVWAVALPVAAATAYLRMAADKHYLTDVLVGTAIGSAFGVAVPLLLHARQGPLGEVAANAELRLVPGVGGASLVGRF